jgi:hypothetical protein
MAVEISFRDALTYVCKTECGYVSDLETSVGTHMPELETVGFVTKGHSLLAMTWRKTKFADQYFKDLYGNFSFWKLKLGLS